MTNRNKDMQILFSQLSEEEKDIMLLIARGMKIAQEAAEQPSRQAE